MFFRNLKPTANQIENYSDYIIFVEDEEYNPNTSIGRFRERMVNWLRQPNGYLEHNFWWILHNCVVHPILGIAPCKQTVNFHDWASKKLNQHEPYWLKTKETVSPIPIIKNRMAWIKHNVIAHMGIGLFPCLKTFHYHDLTSLQMNVPNWV